MKCICGKEASQQFCPECHALDWIRRGMPEDEIMYDEDCPETSEKDWKDSSIISFKIEQNGKNHTDNR